MPQFTLSTLLPNSQSATITDRDDWKHIVKVLRLTEGDWLMVTDGQGTSAKAVIDRITPETIELRLTTLPQQLLKGTLPVLAPAIVKHDKMDWIIQKAVELGCARIMPYTSQRTIPHYKEKTVDSRLTRWNKIAIEAAKQCGIPFTPTIDPPIAFSQLVDSLSHFDHSFLFWEGVLSPSPIAPIAPANSSLIIIGPEGGLSSEEAQALHDGGATICSLGPLILRAETAAITALTVVQHARGHFALPPLVNQ